MLWIFARLSQTELVLPLVPVVAANIWHLGVFIGIVAILIGDSTGFTWLEFPRGSSVLLFAAFLLIAISAVATFGQRKERELYPSHWFLLAALLWFPWIYSTANLFLVVRPSGSRRGAGRHRLVVCEQSDFRLARARRPRHGVLFPAEICRTSAAKPLLCAVRVLDFDFVRNVVRHSARRAGARVAAGVEFRRVRL